MKKITQYIYLFLFIGFLAVGFVCNLPNLFASVDKAVKEYPYEAWSIIVGNEFNDNIWNRYAGVEVNGLVHKILGQDRMNGIVRLDNGKVVTIVEQKDVTQQAQSVAEMNAWLEEKDIEFLYVQTPYEVCDVDSKLPTGIKDYSNDNAGRFLSLLDEAEVPCLNLHESMHSQNLDHYNMFYMSDHHWKVETAFWAYGEIVGCIEEHLGCVVPEMYVSKESYSAENLGAIMLGSNGRKTGFLYSGLDELTIMTPSFDTQVSMTVETDEIYREGTFEEVFLFEERLSGDNIYETAQYDIYMGKDYGVCSLKCDNAPCDQKILIIKDSYSRPIMAFMGATYSQVDAIDMRYYGGDVYEYIEETKPDMVVVVYNPHMLNSVDNFAFNGE